MEDKCRACGESQNWKYQFNVFSALSHQSSLLISDILNSSCGLNIHQDDYQSKNICGKCFGYINVFCVFREQCQKTNKCFQNNIDRLENQSKEQLLTNKSIAIENNSDIQSVCIFDDSTQIKNEILIEEDRTDDEHAQEAYLHIETLEKTFVANLPEIQLKSQETKQIKNATKLRSNINDSDDQLSENDNFFMPQPKKIRGDFLPIVQRNEQRFKEANIGIDVWYKCTLCRLSLKNSSEFMEHLDAHPLSEQRKVRKGFTSANFERLRNSIRAKSKINEETSTVVSLQIENTINHLDNQLKSIDHQITTSTSTTTVQQIVNSTPPVIKRKRSSDKKSIKIDNGVCDICGNTYRSAHLSVHRLTHFNHKPYECDICGKRCAQLCTLKQHMMVHTGKARYKCEICSRPCYTPYALRMHQQSHTDERPFECGLCDRKFRRKRLLILHENKVHLGKRVQCKICSLVVKDSNVLRQHIYVHNGLPFMCSMCPKRSKDRKSLQNHLRIEHCMHVELDVIQKDIPVKIESMTPIN